ncbi:exonuclease SbcD [Collibacillus ludicampi]|uniref:Exonuclease SbcD n=1 Tax=Collibacillus ludicampi TaxID=2771369 RepID=A0AAV4LHG4_9BACL|nr:metallophosphoesterase [Collibacillus ludicampi]GIM47163.1 exonuclease SbcD [Collibacillus ludicampi]
MKLLYITDTHIRATSPANRTDDFIETLKAKFREVGHLAQMHEVDAILHGGDFFDIPNPSLAICGDFVALMKEWGKPIYGIAGNHDLFGHNPDTLSRTMLGFINRLGIVRLIHPGERVFLEKGGVRVQLSGQHYHYELDRRDPRLDYCIQEKEADVAIHLVHGMLLDRKFMDGVAHTVVDQIVETAADMTLCGHNHLGFPPVETNGKVFYNPGGFVRLSNHPVDVQRIPQALLIDVTDGSLTYRAIPLESAPNGEEVIDCSKKEEAAFMEQRLAQFVQGIKAAGDYKAVDIGAILNEIADRDGLPADVREEAMRRIAAAEERLAAGSANR